MATTASKNAPAPLALTLFGPMRVLVAGQPLPRLHSRKSLWLLALLVLRGGRSVEREWLAGTLWPDADGDQAFANLRPVLSDLRRALGPEGARLQSPGRHTLRLDLEGADVDALAFDAAVARKTLESLARAVALYTGPLLEGCAEEWAPQERRAREEECLRALETLADISLAAGDHGGAAEYAGRAAALDPWRDGARRRLMEALAKSGDINAALRVYREFNGLLRSDPKAAPDPETSALYARLRAEAKPRMAAPSAVAHAPAFAVTGYLPQPLTDLVGREDECREVAAKLRRCRLMTLTGPGGIGKTRLALEVAALVVTDYADGVWLVSLEALADEARLEGQIASVLGLKERTGQSWQDSLTRHLHDKRLLLVLDNCEHLRPACARVAAYLLHECARVRVLATSREALGVTGETVWAVPPLAVPDPAHLPLGRATLVRVLAGYEGVQLFVERAQAVQKTFALSGDNALAVARVCARLEGLPLAIELAAARVRVLTVAEIAARLADHLGLLTGGSWAGAGRQRTLRATLDWSYGLLSGQEQLLFERLSVFAGGWSLEAAEAVCRGGGVEEWEVLDLLASLIDKSLLMFEAREEDAGRYRLLEMVHQYAKARLLAGGSADSVRAKHRDWYTAFAEKADRELRGSEQQAWLRRLEAEHDNLRAALFWTGTDAEGVRTSLRLAGALALFWRVRGYLSEGRQHLARLLAREEAQGATGIRIRALNGAGTLSCVQGDYVSGRALFEESLTLCRQAAPREALASALGNLGNVALEQGDYAAARALFEESLDIFKEVGHRQRTAASLGNLGQVAFAQRDYTSARAMHEGALALFKTLGDSQGVALSLYALGCVASVRREPAAWALHDEALGMFREVQDKSGISMTLLCLGAIAHQQGDHAAARSMFDESLTLCKSTQSKAGVADGLTKMGGLLLAQAEAKKAVCLWSAAHGLREGLGLPLLPHEREQFDGQTALARAALGEDDFSAAWEAGHALNWEAAADYALEECSGPGMVGDRATA